MWLLETWWENDGSGDVGKGMRVGGGIRRFGLWEGV